ncbi:MAG: IS4 family transposase [Rhodospirillales bacterium]|nr:IS4 family transposase [Rhodospirillales bacterium]
MPVRAGALGHFGDARRAAIGSTLVERVVETGSLVIRKLGGTRAREIAIHRFLSAPSVTCGEMVETLAHRTAAASKGRRIVAAQDTTEINFAGREARRRGLGAAGDGVSAGFFMHPVIAIDSETEAVLGLLDAKIWTRSDEFDPTPARERALEDKESMRWLDGAARAAERLTEAASVVVVADRESDIYAGFARRPKSIDLIVRAAKDRVLDDGSRLFTAPEAWPELVQTEVGVAPSRTGVAARVATVALRAGTVVICHPRHGRDKDAPAHLSLTMVEAREVGWNGEGTPLLWRLLTTIDTADAAEIVRLYRLRWRIEEIFRSLKSDGLRLEETQVQDAGRLFKLALVGLAAATRTVQLVDARDGSDRPATDVIDPGLLPAAEAIGPTLEGKTPRQKNPHPSQSLGWLAWIIARLGGWNCYYKPPGPKTMRAGWSRFASMAIGYIIANQLNL